MLQIYMFRGVIRSSLMKRVLHEAQGVYRSDVCWIGWSSVPYYSAYTTFGKSGIRSHNDQRTTTHDSIGEISEISGPYNPGPLVMRSWAWILTVDQGAVAADAEQSLPRYYLGTFIRPRTHSLQYLGNTINMDRYCLHVYVLHCWTSRAFAHHITSRCSRFFIKCSYST